MTCSGGTGWTLASPTLAYRMCWGLLVFSLLRMAEWLEWVSGEDSSSDGGQSGSFPESFCTYSALPVYTVFQSTTTSPSTQSTISPVSTMGFDMTMLAPGPAGTSMIGESSIDAAGRRGRERMRREQEAKLSATKPSSKEQGAENDAQSEKTLAPQAQSQPHSVSTSSPYKDSDLNSESTTLAGQSTKGEGRESVMESPVDSRGKGIRGRWERIQKKVRGG